MYLILVSYVKLIFNNLFGGGNLLFILCVFI